MSAEKNSGGAQGGEGEEPEKQVDPGRDDRRVGRMPFLIRRLGALFLVVQGLGGLAWWIVLLTIPTSRRFFLAPGAPEVTLLAFVFADLLLYAGGSLAAAYGLFRCRPWGWPILCVHAGAAAYASLYVLTLAAWSGSVTAGAALMAPSLAVPPYLAWRLRPGR